MIREGTNFHFDEIVIAGLGGVGFWALSAIQRDLAGVPVRAYDGDNLSGGSGHMRLPVALDPLTPKVDLHQEFTSLFMGGSSTTYYRAYFTDQPLTDRTLFVDCTDIHDDGRDKLFDYVRSCGATYLRGSYDGNGVGVVSPGIPFPTVQQGYGQQPGQGQSFFAAGMVAMAIIAAMRTGEVPEHQFQIPNSGV